MTSSSCAGSREGDLVERLDHRPLVASPAAVVEREELHGFDRGAVRSAEMLARALRYSVIVKVSRPSCANG